MDLRNSKAWPTSVEEATAVQHLLRAQVILEDRFDPPKIIAGVDCSYDLERDLSRAVIVLIDFKTLQPLYSIQAFRANGFSLRSRLSILSRSSSHS